MATERARALRPELFARLDAALARSASRSGWNPPVVKIKGAVVAIDLCAHRTGGLHSYKIVVSKDHPFLSKLDALPHVPRAVKSPYRRSVRFGYLFASDCWGFMGDMSRAEEAWAKWQEFRENMQ
jgi:hypothetical protein